MLGLGGDYWREAVLHCDPLGEGSATTSSFTGYADEGAIEESAGTSTMSAFSASGGAVGSTTAEVVGATQPSWVGGWRQWGP